MRHGAPPPLPAAPALVPVAGAARPAEAAVLRDKLVDYVEAMTVTLNGVLDDTAAPPIATELAEHLTPLLEEIGGDVLPRL